MTPKNTYRVTILVTVNKKYNAADLRDAIREECYTKRVFDIGNYPFLPDIDAEIDERDVLVEPVRHEEARTKQFWARKLESDGGGR